MVPPVSSGVPERSLAATGKDADPQESAQDFKGRGRRRVAISGRCRNAGAHGGATDAASASVAAQSADADLRADRRGRDRDRLLLRHAAARGRARDAEARAPRRGGEDGRRPARAARRRPQRPGRRDPACERERCHARERRGDHAPGQPEPRAVLSASPPPTRAACRSTWTSSPTGRSVRASRRPRRSRPTSAARPSPPCRWSATTGSAASPSSPTRSSDVEANVTLIRGRILAAGALALVLAAIAG